MNLHDVHKGIHKHKKRRRVGRGKGSGWGKTAGRGHKGQGQLAGWTMHPAFEGGQMPLARRVPKRGFHNRFGREIGIINLSALETLYNDGDQVTPESLKASGLVQGQFELVKVLGNGELTKKLKISAHKFSQSALDKIQKAGGEAIVLPGPANVVKGQEKPKEKRARKPRKGAAAAAKPSA
jgi:large subunit ribosomal protein L15